MPFKTITIKKSAYDKLKRAKKKGESFTNLIERTFDEPDIMEFAGCIDMTDKEYENVMREIYKNRKSAEKNFEERMKHALS